MKKSALISLTSILLLGSFQNCTQQRVGYSSATPSVRAENNGEPYGGKPAPGEYYRQVPGYSCGGQGKIYETLSVQSSQAKLHSIDSATCGDVTSDIDLNAISARSYNQDLIGYNGAAFERLQNPPVLNDPNRNLLEVWCRTSNLGMNTSDVVIHEEVSTGKLTGKIYSALTLPQVIAMNKILGNSQVRYQSSNLQLFVDLASGGGNLSGSVNADVNCVPGGWFDPPASFAPSFALNFSSPILPPSVLFSRPSVARYVDNNGVLQTSAANEPRFEYEVDGSLKGLLLEPSSTNLLLFSEQFNSPPYIYQQATVLPDVDVAPDGSMTADALIEGAGSVTPYVSQSINGDRSKPYTCTAYVKARGRTKTIVKIDRDPVDYCSNEANLTAESVYEDHQGTGSSCRSFMQPIGGGWYRVGVSGIVDPAGGAGTIFCSIFPSGAAAGQNFVPYTGDGSSGLLIWGIQLEQSTLATSYIATTNTTASRQADSVVVSTSGWYNADSGSILGIGQKSLGRPVGVTPLSLQKMYSFVGANGAEYAGLFDESAGKFSAHLQAPGGAPLNSWNSSVDPTLVNEHKLLMLYDSAVPSLWVDGINSSAAATTAPLSANSLNIGDGWNGYIKSLTYWPKRMPDAMAAEFSK